MDISVAWIDDNAKVMNEVVSYVFPNLWNENIKAYIGITNESEKAVKDLNRIIFQTFVSYIIDEEYINDNKKVLEKEKLVKTLSEISEEKERIPIADVALDISDLFKKYQKDIRKFYEEHKILDNTENISGNREKEEDNVSDSSADDNGHIKKNDSFFEEFTNDVTDRFIDDIMDKFPKDSWYGIDLCLIEGDYDILKDKKDSPILSMALYDALIKKTKKVFLYTTYFVPKNVIEGWHSLYKKYFRDDREKIKIFKRNGENALEPGNPNEIIELFKEAEK